MTTCHKCGRILAGDAECLMPEEATARSTWLRQHGFSTSVLSEITRPVEKVHGTLTGGEPEAQRLDPPPSHPRVRTRARVIQTQPPDTTPQAQPSASAPAPIPQHVDDGFEALSMPRVVTRTSYERFTDVRRSPERRALYDRVLLRTADVTLHDLLTFAGDELREASYHLRPTCEVEGRPVNDSHASACIQRAHAAIRQIRRIIGENT